MLDERSSRVSLRGIVILIVVVSLFFVPNSAFANGFFTPADMVMIILVLITIVVFPIALVYLGIISLRSIKPSLGNYIHSNRFIVIGFYFLAEGLSWVIFRAILSMPSGTWVPFGMVWTDFFILIVIPGILLISIGVAKDWLSNIPRLIGIIFLAVGIGWISFFVYNASGRLFYSVIPIIAFIPTILFFSIGGILIIKYRKSKSKQQDLARNKERISE